MFNPLSPLDELTDEEKQKLLADFAPGPIHTGPMTRGAGAFAPRVARTPGASFESEAASPKGVDPDLFARFAAAQQRGAKLDALNALGHGFGADAALIAGTGVNTIAREPGRRNQPIQELSARLNAERSIQQQDRQKELDAVNLAKTKADTRKSEVAALADEAEAKREAALADPASPESTALRATASELLKGRISPETLATMSGVQLREALKFGTSMVNAEAMAEYRNSQMEQSAQNSALDRQLRAEALAQGWNIAQLTASQREWMFEREAQLRKELAELAATKEATKNARERDEKLAERAVGGYRFAPGRTPDADSAKKMREVAIDIGKLRRSLKNLRDLYSKHGTQLFGEHAGLMESEFMAITNTARNLNNMGVPNGADYMMLAKEIQDPTTLRDLFTSRERNLAKMDILEKRMGALVDDTAKVYGYEAESGANTPRVPMHGGDLGVKSSTAPSKKPAAPASKGKMVKRPPLDPTKEVARRTYSTDGKLMRVVYTDGTVGYGPSDRKPE